MPGRMPPTSGEEYDMAVQLVVIRMPVADAWEEVWGSRDVLERLRYATSEAGSSACARGWLMPSRRRLWRSAAAG